MREMQVTLGHKSRCPEPREAGRDSDFCAQCTPASLTTHEVLCFLLRHVHGNGSVLNISTRAPPPASVNTSTALRLQAPQAAPATLCPTLCPLKPRFPAHWHMRRCIGQAASAQMCAEAD